MDCYNLYMEYFGAIDQGTTSSRFIIFDTEHNLKHSHQVEFEQILSKPGYVEHDPEVIWDSVVTCVQSIAQNFDLSCLTSIGITNQRETIIAWQKSTGEALHNAIVWQDTRTQDICNNIKAISELEGEFEKTGLPIATYFSLSKIIWLIENVEAVKSALVNDDISFGTIDSWLLYKLTGNHLTDITNASRTLMFNLYTSDWNDKILNYFNIPRSALPTIKPSLSLFANTTNLFNKVPITAVLGDQQASLFGHKGFSKGEIKNTYGTGCFLLCNTGEEIIHSTNGLLTTVAYQVESEKPMYALEGSVAIAGASIQWLRDNIGIIQNSDDVEKLALEVKDNGDVYFVPAFSGLFSPYWDPTARGTIVGLTRHSNKSHIARAVLESVTYQTNEVLNALEKDLRYEQEVLSVDGGMVVNNLLMQYQSDISDIQIQAPNITEVTAYGVALASYLFIRNIAPKSFSNSKTAIQTWTPNMSVEKRQKYLLSWNKAIEKAKNWI